MSAVEPTNPAPAKGRLVLWLLALGVPLLLLLAWWPSGKPKARPALPNPNGYDYFVKASEALAGPWTNQLLRAVPAHEWQTVLSANHASLELVREGLRHRSLSQVSVAYDSATKLRFIDQLGYLKRLGVLLAGEGRLAEMEARPAAAVASYLEAMRFGQESSRGGVMMERLVGIAIESIALSELLPLLPKLDAPVTRRTLEGLRQLDALHDPAAVSLEAEDDWVRHSFPVRERMVIHLHPALRKSTRDARESFAKKVDALQATRRRTIVEAAARLFELEKGRRPTGYTDLVPAYLRTVPLDPTTGKEIAHPF
jgi:hypothetical protein